MKLIDELGPEDEAIRLLHETTDTAILLRSELLFDDVEVVSGHLVLRFPWYGLQVEYDIDNDTKTVRRLPTTAATT